MLSLLLALPGWPGQAGGYGGTVMDSSRSIPEQMMDFIRTDDGLRAAVRLGCDGLDDRLGDGLGDGLPVNDDGLGDGLHDGLAANL